MQAPVGKDEARAPRREHLESQARQGDIEAQLELADIPQPPRLAAHVWTSWCDLSATRPQTGMGISPISRTEIAQWEADEGVALERWERRAILRIDAAFREMMSARDDAAEEEEEG